ncbi:ABC-type transport auxiliary lipoprotein family protein [Caldimonas tepidiphila]|uniref:ABC-type transport auxiliary lipoprotein family protein n=1 Tax=Caldimonas tepidiphila TaxID=2315841 RepID=UPI000E5ABB66|nr:ABC-type transport auxiliary lipoprotein family protein [Caldimonas tepidiphila]
MTTRTFGNAASRPAPTRRRLAGALALLPLAALGGCQALGRQPFAVLQPRPVLPAISGAPVRWQLMVDTPSASDLLDSTHIAVMPVAGVVKVYPDARWPEPVPLLLRSLVVRGFENSGRIIGVGTPASGLSPDVALAMDLHDFQIENAGGAARAAVRLHARLLDPRSGRVLDAQPFVVEVPALGETAQAALPAFEHALSVLIPQLVVWTLREGRELPQKKG